MIPKRYRPPPKRSPAGKRRTSRLRLCLHVKRGADDMAEPEAMNHDKPLWRFVVRGHLRNGTSKTKTFAALDWREAEIAAAKIADEWARVPVPILVGRTMNDLIAAFLAAKRSPDSTMRPSTVDDLEAKINRFIRPMLGQLALDAITADVITEWKRLWCPLTLKSRTRAHRLGLLSSLLLFAVRRGWLASSPIIIGEHTIPVVARGLTSGQVVGDARQARAMTPEEISRIAAAMDADDPAARMLVLLTGACGFRIREATHLRTEDLVFHQSGAAFVTVRSSFVCSCVDCRTNGERLTKSGASRLVPIAPDVGSSLRAYVEQRNAKFGPSSWLFPVWRRGRGAHLRPGDIRSAMTLRKNFQRAAAAVGITDIVFHDLRASAKSNWIIAGAASAAADVAIGHRLKGMDAVYLKLTHDLVGYYQALYPSWGRTLVLHGEVQQQQLAKSA